MTSLYVTALSVSTFVAAARRRARWRMPRAGGSRWGSGRSSPRSRSSRGSCCCCTRSGREPASLPEEARVAGCSGTRCARRSRGRSRSLFTVAGLQRLRPVRVAAVDPARHRGHVAGRGGRAALAVRRDGPARRARRPDRRRAVRPRATARRHRRSSRSRRATSDCSSCPATATWLWVALAGIGPLLFPLVARAHQPAQPHPLGRGRALGVRAVGGLPHRRRSVRSRSGCCTSRPAAGPGRSIFLLALDRARGDRRHDRRASAATSRTSAPPELAPPSPPIARRSWRRFPARRRGRATSARPLLI